MLPGFLNVLDDNPPLEIVPPGGFQDLPAPRKALPQLESEANAIRAAANESDSFMNALPFLVAPGPAIIAGGEKGIAEAIRGIAHGGKQVASNVIDIGTRKAREATEPIANAVGEMGKGLEVMGDFLGQGLLEADKISKRVFWGEMALAAVSLLGLGAAWWLSKKKSVTQIVLGKGGG